MNRDFDDEWRLQGLVYEQQRSKQARGGSKQAREHEVPPHQDFRLPDAKRDPAR